MKWRPKDCVIAVLSVAGLAARPESSWEDRQAVADTAETHVERARLAAGTAWTTLFGLCNPPKPTSAIQTNQAPPKRLPHRQVRLRVQSGMPSQRSLRQSLLFSWGQGRLLGVGRRDVGGNHHRRRALGLLSRGPDRRRFEETRFRSSDNQVSGGEPRSCGSYRRRQVSSGTL
jgi:hypothetical protein